MLHFVVFSQSTNLCNESPTNITTNIDKCSYYADPYKLVFYDEFNGTSIDINKWYTYYPYATPPDGTHVDERTKSGELENYLDGNVWFDNTGILHLFALRQWNTTNGITKPFNSGMINSKQIFTNYGKYEIRCQVPQRDGFWPAFWVFGWSTEIDCFDDFNGAEKLQVGCVKWTNACGYPTSGQWSSNVKYHNNRVDEGYKYCTSDLSQSFHTYTMEYDPFKINFYLDNVCIYTIFRYYEDLLGGAPVFPFLGCNLTTGTWLQNPSYPKIGDPVQVIANLAVGGAAGLPGVNEFGDVFGIDYIRVYQRVPEAGLTDLCDRHFQGDDCIDLNDEKTYNVTGAYGNLTWSVSSNLEIINTNPSSIKIKAKPNTSGQIGHIYLSETDAPPCATSWAIDKVIDIGTPPPPTFTNFGCGNGYTIVSGIPFTIDIDNNTFSGFPILNGGAIGDPNANTINGYTTNFVPIANDKVCIPYTFTATNSCGTATYSGFIQNNCIPYNGQLFTLCQRSTASIDMVEFGGHLNIYPNPATSNINIVFTDRYNTLVKECKILNGFDGEIVANVNPLGENTNINCEGWERGLYLIYMQIETGQSFSRLISLY